MKRNTDGNKSSMVSKIIFGNKAFLLIILLVIVLSSLTPAFLTGSNLLNVLRQICVSCIAALGFTFVIAAGHIDLSVGAVVGFIGIIMSYAMRYWGVSVPVAILIGLGIGLCAASVNALIVNVFSLPSFVVTLATQSVFRGVTYMITEMRAVTLLPDSFVKIGQGYVFEIPIPVIILAVFIVLMFFLANRSMFGRYVIAMGGNSNAARASGINIKKTTWGVFLVMGIAATIAAVILTARSASGQVEAGKNMEMDCIAAVVIGGTSMSGGNMSIIGTVVGSIIIGLANNGLNLLGVSTDYQTAAKGLIILLALVLDVVTTRVYARIVKREALAAFHKKNDGPLDADKQ